MDVQARSPLEHEAAGSATSDKPPQQQPRRLSSPRKDALSVHVPNPQPKSKPRRSRNDASSDSTKRRCISTACVACRKRKSKCDGNTPSCAACASVYGTPCVYDPNSDHRRKGVYKNDSDSLKTRNSTLQTLISAILNYPQDEVPGLVRQIRACESLEKVAEAIVARENGDLDHDLDLSPASPASDDESLSFERQLYSKVGELRLEDGSVRFIGGTSNLLYDDAEAQDDYEDILPAEHAQSREQVIRSWTSVDTTPDTIMHLLKLYFTWHYPFFTVLSQASFWRDFNRGNTGRQRKSEYCSPLLVNVMLALGCHFSSLPSARSNSEDSATAGDHFFKEAKRLIEEGDEYGKPRMTTVQALALMSVREAGCGREAKGWVYSGISFRMACDLGINFETEALIGKESGVDEEEEDVRRLTFWGCFLVDKCWSNYLGRLPLFQASNNITTPRFDVFPDEDAETWTPYTDSGSLKVHSQPSRVRAVALQLSALCDISGDLMKYFYHPQDKHPSRQAELKRLSEIHTRLETWRRDLPKEMDAREGSLPSVLVMHMLFQLLHIHLFRPFLKYLPNNSPLPPHVSPRKLCTNAAGTISKLLRLYKRSYGLRQICNIAVYIAHSACTIHLLNLPEKNAARDISHGVRHLEEIADCWLCARRTLRVLSLQARKWQIELPEDAAQTLSRTDARYGLLGSPRISGASDRHHALPSGQIPSSKSLHPNLQLHSPWSAQPGQQGVFMAGNLSYTFGVSSSSTTPEPLIASGANLAGLTAGFQAPMHLQGLDQSSGVHAGQNVGTSHLNLLQQQQAWSEAAARNGIPTVPVTSTNGLHRPTTSLLKNTNNESEQGESPSSLQHRLQPLNANDPLPGPAFHPSQIPMPPNPTNPSTVHQSQSLHPINSQTPPDHTSTTRNPLGASNGPDATPQSHTSEPLDRAHGPTARRSYGSMFGGVEALLREAHEWWVEDATPFASGFSNWMLESRRNSAAGGAGGVENGSGQQQQPHRLRPGSEEATAGRGAAALEDVPIDLSGLGRASSSGTRDAYDEADWFG